MTWLEAIPETVWERLVELSNSLVTVVVALMVAMIATRRETKKQLAQRHFDFRDERADIYSDFLERANLAFFEFSECYSSIAMLTKQEVKQANEAAIRLDTAAQRLQVHTPEFVAHACLNLNGRLQFMIANLYSPSEIDMKALEYEETKRNTIKVMKVDLRLIEQTTDRSSYQALLKRENSRYFAEVGMEEPSK